MKTLLLSLLSAAFVFSSCQNNELLIEENDTNTASRAVNGNIQYSAQNGMLTWKCGVLSGQIGSQVSTVAIEMEMNFPKTFYALSYYDFLSQSMIKNPVVEDAGGIDVHTIEHGEGYAILYSFVSGEDLLNVWLEGQEFDDAFQIPCYVFDMNSYSQALNESETTLIISPSVQSRSEGAISSIEIMTYDKQTVFTQTYTEGITNAGVNIATFDKGKYVVKIKDESGTTCYQRLIID